jgi:hypothetical protein
MSRARSPIATRHKPIYDLSRYIPLVEYAKLLNYSQTAVRRQIYTLKVEAFKRGGNWYVLKPKKAQKR